LGIVENVVKGDRFAVGRVCRAMPTVGCAYTFIGYGKTRESLEEAARAVLKHLGELKRPYLSELEEKLLGFIEQEYGIVD
jgi:hypothetical protein